MPFEWTTQTEEAAQLLADGRLSNVEIAAKLQVDRKTLWNWRQVAEFQERVSAILAEFREEAERRGIARRERRLKRLNDHWNRLQLLIEERADAAVKRREDAERKGEEKAEFAPGERTGLMVYDEGWVVDTGTLKELRALEKQAAIETGQWTEKRELSGKDGGPVLVKVLKGVSMDDL